MKRGCGKIRFVRLMPPVVQELSSNKPQVVEIRSVVLKMRRTRNRMIRGRSGSLADPAEVCVPVSAGRCVLSVKESAWKMKNSDGKNAAML